MSFVDYLSMSEAALIPEPEDIRMHAKPLKQRLCADWLPSSRPWEKHIHAYRTVQCFTSIDQFDQFFHHLYDVDIAFYRDYGGEILTQVLEAKNQHYSDSFDQRYLRLFHLFSNYDLDAAHEFHVKAKKLFHCSSNSFVRYERIFSALKNAAGIIRTYQHQDGEHVQVSVLPMLGGWKVKRYPLQQKDQFIAADHGAEITLAKIELEHALERKIKPLTSLGDCEIAESRWLSRLNANSATSIGCYSLPNARISKMPTGIAFNIDGEWRYLNPSADMYHYFRMSGKAVFSSTSRKIKQAYVLPRTGEGNYYCSLLNRLPALYAYHYLGLRLPIVSAYKLSKIEKIFAEKMGMSVDHIEVDEKGELEIEKAIVPTMADLKILFARFCMSLSKSNSQFGTRIYISRRNAPDRVMANEDELEKLLEKYGFDIVAMEKYQLDEQMAITGNAELIVAPHGAGLANMIFAKPGTGIYELVPEYYMQSSFRQLAHDCGHKYSMQLGKRITSGANESQPISWAIDIDKFKIALEDILNNSANDASGSSHTQQR